LHAFYQQDAKEADADFIDVLKESADIVASVKHVISRIEVEKPNITTTFQDYQKRVESLHKEIAEKQASLKDLAAQKEEVTRLQSELDTISKEIHDLQSVGIEKLKKYCDEKNKKLYDLRSEKEKLRGDIVKINKQLQAEEKNISDEQIIAKLRELSKMLPAGVEY
jgi:chromosome segregation ATPase